MSSYASWQEDLLEEEEDEFADENASPERDCVIFAIDATAPMHTLDSDGVSFFNSAIRCAAKFLQTKIIQAESDMMGMVLFGTKESENEQKFKHIIAKYDLATPDVDRILELEGIVKNQQLSNLESSDDYSLAEVFWQCSNMFSAKAPKDSTQRIFLITHNDRPHAGNTTLLQNVRVRAKDLEDLGISIELFPIQLSPDHLFDFSAFYQNLPGIDGNADDDDPDTVKVPATASDKFEILSMKIMRREVKKRTTFRVPFKLHDGLTIGVKGYNLVQEQKKGSHTYLDRRKNQEVQPVTTWKCSTLAAVGKDATIGQADMKSYWPYGGSKVIFSKEEVNSIRHLCEPGLVLLGFKPRFALKDKHNLRHSSFIYPDEKEYSGSSSVYANLLDRMHAREKIAICRLTARVNTAPRLVALVPEMRSKGDEVPSGFHVIYLPYADDNRRNVAPPLNVVPEEHRTLAESFIKKLVIKRFSPTNYENPVLQKHYNNLQAIALMKDFAEDIDDKTRPMTENMHRLVGGMIGEFKKTVLDGVDETAVPTKKKRGTPAADADGAAAPKRARGGAMTFDAVRAKAVEGKLSSYTVAQMTDFLLENNPHDVKPAKKKAELIAQVLAVFGL